MSDLAIFTSESFRALETLDERILRQLDHLKFDTSTQVQKAAIPAVVAGADCLIRSPTGSGKTLAFALPVLQRFLSQNATAAANTSSNGGNSSSNGGNGFSRDTGVFSIIVSPSKELAMQTQLILEQLVRMMPGIVVGCLAGGENPQKEKHRIRKGLTIVCGTPGRILYHLDQTENFKTNTGNCAMLVLDEADRLLDLGFEKQLRAIKQRLLSGQRSVELQTVMVSATLSSAVKDMASWCLRKDSVFVDPMSVNSAAIKAANKAARKAAYNAASGEAGLEAEEEGEEEGEEEEGKFHIASTITQSVVHVSDERSRLLLLLGILLEAENKGLRKVMVFLSSCASVDFHRDMLPTLTFPKPPRQNTHLRVMTTREIKKANADPKAYDREKFRMAEASRDADDQPDVAASTEGIISKKMKLYKLHGDLNSADRAGNISGFRKCEGTAVLLCTDVAARGLDISEVDLVVQYDAPQQAEEYLHRVGRTGRIGRKGSALIFLNTTELGFVELIMGMCVNMKKPGEVEAEMLVEAVKRKYSAVYEKGTVDRIRDLPSYLTSEICKAVTGDEELLRTARKAFVSTLRAYRTFQGKAMRKIFDWRNLHSGHVAKNFGIAETPKEVAMKNKETDAFKKRPHNLMTRVAGEKYDEGDKTKASKRRKITGRSTNTLANMEFAA